MHRRELRYSLQKSLGNDNGALRDVISSAGLRFNRLTDDINDMAGYMKDIRMCFIALTLTVYLILFVCIVRFCFLQRQRRMGNGQRRTRNWDYGNDSQPDYRNQTGQMEDLVSVRSDGQVGTGMQSMGSTVGGAGPPPPVGSAATAAFMRSNHRSAAPFMRHGRHMNHNFSTAAGYGNQTRLISDADTVKHQIPHITTQEIPDTNNGQSASPPPATAAVTIPSTNSTSAPTQRTTLHHRTTTVEANGDRHHATDM